MAKKGRPLEVREAGSGVKLRRWFELTGETANFLDRDRFPAGDPAAKGLPRLATIARWKVENMPKAKIALIANVLATPAHLWAETTPLEVFEDHVRAQGAPARPAPKPAPLPADIVTAVRTALANNEHVGDVLNVLCGSVGMRSIDDIAKQVGVSIIVVREIVGALSGVGVVELSANAKPHTGAPNNVALSQSAQLHRDEIVALINGD